MPPALANRTADVPRFVKGGGGGMLGWVGSGQRVPRTPRPAVSTAFPAQRNWARLPRSQPGS